MTFLSISQCKCFLAAQAIVQGVLRLLLMEVLTRKTLFCYICLFLGVFKASQL